MSLLEELLAERGIRIADPSNRPKTMEELAGGELCDYCPTTFGHSPTTLCEGSYCEEAYQNYLDEQEEA